MSLPLPTCTPSPGPTLNKTGNGGVQVHMPPQPATGAESCQERRICPCNPYNNPRQIDVHNFGEHPKLQWEPSGLRPTWTGWEWLPVWTPSPLVDMV